MSRTLHRTATASAGAALLLVLAACGSTGNGGDAGSSTSSDDLPKGALDEFIEQVYGGENQDAIDRMMMQTEERVAECMAGAGFEYVPVDWSQSGGGTPDAVDVEWGTPEFAEKYGYGATTNPLDVASDEMTTDPNQANNEIVEAMSETERQAYEEALWGPQVESDAEGEVDWSWENGGCQGLAQHESEVENGMAGDEFRAMEEEIWAMEESVASDPRITALHADWASCMADAGYTGFSTPDDAEQSIREQVDAIYEEAYAGTDESTPEAEYDAIFEEVDEKLAEITDEELATARADFACRDEVDLLRTQAEVNVEYQQEFYDAHEEQLEIVREAMTKG